MRVNVKKKLDTGTNYFPRQRLKIRSHADDDAVTFFEQRKVSKQFLNESPRRQPQLTMIEISEDDRDIS